MGFWKLSLIPWFWVACFYSKYGQEGTNNKYSQLPETFYCLGADPFFSWMTFIFPFFNCFVCITLFLRAVSKYHFREPLCSQHWQNCRDFKLSMKAWTEYLLPDFLPSNRSACLSCCYDTRNNTDAYWGKTRTGRKADKNNSLSELRFDISSNFTYIMQPDNLWWWRVQLREVRERENCLLNLVGQLWDAPQQEKISIGNHKHLLFTHRDAGMDLIMSWSALRSLE